ncbi:MAG: ATP-binding protein [Cyanobacteria bacterium P01_E01_bin.42]
MRANPGGEIAPDEIIGRDRLIERLWRVLERQSLILSAERRMGKTCVIRKMAAYPPDNKLIVLRNVEDLGSPLEFVQAVLQDVEQYLSKYKRTARKTRELLKNLADIELKGMGLGIKLPDIAAPHWKNLLTQTIEDLLEVREGDRLIFFWDEMPHMLRQMEANEAMEMLDVLRRLRQTYGTLRMVFTGSIGLHHVIDKLRKSGYTGEPTNDMYPLDVPPLLEEDGTTLATLLIQGESISTFEIQTTAREIARMVDCVPFYIHHLIEALALQGETIDERVVNETIDDCLSSPQNRWQMEHYSDRIEFYYSSERRKYALGLLDALAESDEGLSLDELCDRLRSDPDTEDKEETRKVLNLLAKDYYIVKDKELKYRFRLDLIERYWKLSRG